MGRTFGPSFEKTAEDPVRHPDRGPLALAGMGQAFGPKTMSLREFDSGFDPLD